MNTLSFVTKQIQVLLVFLWVVWPCCFLAAQVNIQFTPALNGQSVNGLFTGQVQNMTAIVYTGKIKITVRDGAGKIVLLAITPVVTMPPGNNSLQPFAAQTKMQFGNSASAAIIAQTGHFPENEYEYCFEFTASGNKVGADEQVFENCFNYSVRPVIPLSLIYPGDGDELCSTRPEFSWQPAMPLVSSYRYRIMVSEQQEKQNAADALLNNLPVFQQDNIAGFMLLYPPQVPDLQKEKKYVWQVLAYVGNAIITRSDIWQFTINCHDKNPDEGSESYRQLSGSLNGNYYMATSTVHFSIINPLGITAVQYTITDIADPAKIISNLPAVKAQTGLNKVDIPLEDINGLQVGKMYLLKVKNIGDHSLYLQFIYKTNENK